MDNQGQEVSSKVKWKHSPISNCRLVMKDYTVGNVCINGFLI